MAVRKKAQKKEVKSEEIEINQQTDQIPSKKIISKRNLIILLALGLLLLAYYKKSWFVAALVNNQPITSLELQTRLNQQFRSQLLNQMINEKIIEQEAVKKGVTVTFGDINSKVAETENQYGGTEPFNTLLSQQGVSRDDFIKQIKLQLIVEKIYESDINPTEDEIKQFIDQNKSDPEATDAAKFRGTATNLIRQQKLQTVFQEKFQQLKQSAKITIF